MILFDLTNGGNLSGFMTLWLTPYAIGWLLLTLLLFGVTKVVRTNRPVANPVDEDGRQENQAVGDR